MDMTQDARLAVQEDPGFPGLPAPGTHPEGERIRVTRARIVLLGGIAPDRFKVIVLTATSRGRA